MGHKSLQLSTYSLAVLGLVFTLVVAATAHAYEL